MKEDIILALNKALQKAQEPTLVRFCSVKCLQSGAISSFFTKKAKAEDLLNVQKNIFIWAAKIVDALVIGVETLEHWQCLKVHGMLLDSYLKDGRIEILKKEVELLTKIQLKTVSQWLIYKNRLKKRQKLGNN